MEKCCFKLSQKFSDGIVQIESEPALSRLTYFCATIRASRFASWRSLESGDQESFDLRADMMVVIPNKAFGIFTFKSSYLTKNIKVTSQGLF